jgi:hypothetical protein
VVISFFKKGFAAKAFSFAALLSAITIEWMLVNVPVSDVSGVFPATVRARDEMVTFTTPAAVTGDAFLFRYTPPSEMEKVTLDAFFDRAELSDATITNFRSLQVSAPAATEVISFASSHANSGSCATALRVETITGQLLSVEFLQTPDDTSSGYRALAVRLNGADGLVTLSPQGAFQNGGSPCKVDLTVGDWKQSTQGFLPIQIRVPAGESFRFHWRNLSEHNDNTWKTASSAVSLLTFGASASDQFLSEGIAIRSVNPKTGKADDPPSLEALGLKSAPLTVSYFRINQNQLEIEASGQGRAFRHGSVVRKNVLEAVDKYPIPSALLGAANLALIAWVKRAFWPSQSQKNE